MPALQQTVTPCIYAFSQEIAIRAARENKAILRSFLNREEILYKTVFAIYRWSLNERLNKAIARDNFLDRVWKDDQIDGASEAAVKELCRPVFDHYWRFATMPPFLKKLELLEYQIFLEDWRDIMAAELEQQEYHITRLQEILQR